MKPIFDSIISENLSMARLHNRMNQISALLRLGTAVFALGIVFTDSSGEEIRAQNMPHYNNETGEWIASLDLYESRAWPWDSFHVKIISCFLMVDGALCIQRAGSGEWHRIFGKTICRKGTLFGESTLPSSSLLIDNMTICQNELPLGYTASAGHYLYYHPLNDKIYVRYVGEKNRNITICLSDIKHSTPLLSKLRWDNLSGSLDHQDIDDPFSEADLAKLIDTYAESRRSSPAYGFFYFFAFFIKICAIIIFSKSAPDGFNLISGNRNNEWGNNVWNSYNQTIQSFIITNTSLHRISNDDCLLKNDVCFFIEFFSFLFFLMMLIREPATEAFNIGGRDYRVREIRAALILFFWWHVFFILTFLFNLLIGDRSFLARIDNDSKFLDLALISTGYELSYLFIENINNLINLFCCSMPVCLVKACLTGLELYIIVQLIDMRSIDMSRNLHLMWILVTVGISSHIATNAVEMRLLLSRSKSCCFFRKKPIEPNNEIGMHLEQLREHELEHPSQPAVSFPKDNLQHLSNLTAERDNVHDLILRGRGTHHSALEKRLNNLDDQIDNSSQELQQYATNGPSMNL